MTKVELKVVVSEWVRNYGKATYLINPEKIDGATLTEKLRICRSVAKQVGYTHVGYRMDHGVIQFT